MEYPITPARVFLAEDHPIFRAALKPHINKDPSLQVCGEAEDVEGALTGIARTDPHLVILDLQLRRSSGFELIQAVRQRWPAMRLLVLTMHADFRYAARALKAGAAGFVTKYAGPDVVLQAIRVVLRGGTFVSEEMQQDLLRHGDAAGAVTDVLTDRELSIFLLVGEGKSPEEIAETLQMGKKTVHNHMSNIKRRLRLPSRQQLYQQAKEWVLHPKLL